eukprot:COSAG04_NODE_164_length_21771_cov_415.923219_4_plen_248_part_00
MGDGAAITGRPSTAAAGAVCALGLRRVRGIVRERSREFKAKTLGGQQDRGHRRGAALREQPTGGGASGMATSFPSRMRPAAAFDHCPTSRFAVPQPQHASPSTSGAGDGSTWCSGEAPGAFQLSAGWPTSAWRMPPGRAATGVSVTSVPATTPCSRQRRASLCATAAGQHGDRRAGAEPERPSSAPAKGCEPTDQPPRSPPFSPPRWSHRAALVAQACREDSESDDELMLAPLEQPSYSACTDMDIC